MIYSLYIFSRHCEVIYYQDWHRRTPLTRAPPGAILPHVSPSVSVPLSEGREGGMAAGANQRRGGLPFDEEAKLVYGVVLSLRNMVKKLTGSPTSQFQSYATPAYAMHLFETPTNVRFVLLTSPNVDSALIRTVLRTLWGAEGAWGRWVTGNPEKRGAYLEEEEREGVDSEQFRRAVDAQMRALPYYATP